MLWPHDQLDRHSLRAVVATGASAVVLVVALITTTGAEAGAQSARQPAAAVPGFDQSQLVRPRPTFSATPTPRPPTASPATPAPSPTVAACAFPTVDYNGAAYCPAAISAVQNTVYGTGTRVVLNSVTVTAVTTGTVTVATWALPPCPSGKYCGQILTLQSLTVNWTGTGRPGYGDVLDLFGLTIAASISPVGYIATGHCPIEWC